jgi:hypothetical protein
VSALDIRAAMRAELRGQSEVMAAIIGLADAVRAGGSAREIADAVENIAWQLDRDRRGAMSAASRQDAVEVADTIAHLMRDDLLAPSSRDHVREVVREALGVGPARPHPVEQVPQGEPKAKARRARR